MKAKFERGFRGTLPQQPGQRLRRGAEAELDAVGEAGLAPIAPRHLRPLLADIAGDELAVPRQRRGHRQGAVAGEGADLYRPPTAPVAAAQDAS